MQDAEVRIASRKPRPPRSATCPASGRIPFGEPRSLGIRKSAAPPSRSPRSPATPAPISPRRTRWSNCGTRKRARGGFRTGWQQLPRRSRARHSGAIACTGGHRSARGPAQPCGRRASHADRPISTSRGTPGWRRRKTGFHLILARCWSTIRASGCWRSGWPSTSWLAA